MTFQVDTDIEKIKPDLISGQYRPNEESSLSGPCVISEIWPNKPPSEHLHIFISKPVGLGCVESFLRFKSLHAHVIREMPQWLRSAQ